MAEPAAAGEAPGWGRAQIKSPEPKPGAPISGRTGDQKLKRRPAVVETLLLTKKPLASPPVTFETITPP